MNSIILGLDKGSTTLETINKFNLNNDDVSLEDNDKNNIFNYNFVGFVFDAKNTLIVLPHNYYENNEIDKINENYSSNYKLNEGKKLFQIINKYIQNTSRRANAELHIGIEENFKSNYPFMPFFNIYSFYKKYGIYQENISTIKPGYSGKISWKKTIQDSNLIVSNGNFIYNPLYVTTKSSVNVFITECMIFAIKFTLTKFHNIIELEYPTETISNFNFFENIDFVIKKLQEYNSKTFKDTFKFLIHNLIEFFMGIRNLENEGGKIHVKIKYFHNIWQDMVTQYLNTYFIGIDNISGNVLFSDTPINNYQFNTKYLDIDDSNHKFSMSFDHFTEDKNDIYIFDSKYYAAIKSLDYKQFTYTQILQNMYPHKRINSSLVVPTSQKNHSVNHLLLKSGLKGNLINPIIYEIYLSMNLISNKYLKN